MTEWTASITGLLAGYEPKSKAERLIEEGLFLLQHKRAARDVARYRARLW